MVCVMQSRVCVYVYCRRVDSPIYNLLCIVSRKYKTTSGEYMATKTLRFLFVVSLFVLSCFADCCNCCLPVLIDWLLVILYN